MKNIIYVDILKPYNENYFINRKGETTEKNIFFAKLLDKIGSKNIGCMIEVDNFYKNNVKEFANFSECGSSYGQLLSSFIKEKEIIDFFNVVNLFLEERCLYCFKDNGRFFVQVFNKKTYLKNLFTPCKNNAVNCTIPIYDPFTNTQIEVKKQVKKGVRLLNADDIKEIKNSLPSGLIDAIAIYNTEYKKNQSTTETKKDKKTVSA